jgi:hypothetical protein
MRKRFALITATVGAALTLGLTAPGAQAAVPQDGAVQAKGLKVPGVDCSTGVSESDDLEGYANCDNNTAGPVEFRVNLVCGVAPDVSSEWVRLEPGAGAQAVAGCAPYSTGIGGVSAESRPV